MMDKNGPAFGHGDERNGGDLGMTKREWYAGLAMQGILANGCEVPYKPESEAQLAAMSYQIADHMLCGLENLEWRLNIALQSLGMIAEDGDAGRHDGLGEACPNYNDVYYPWMVAKEALEEIEREGKNG